MIRVRCSTVLTTRQVLEGESVSDYLRFTPDEFRAISEVCRSIKLTDDFFPLLQYFLVESLTGTFPSLAERIAHFRGPKLTLLYGYLSKQRKNRKSAATPAAWTFEELQAVYQASLSYQPHNR